jgi:hypothetical protein
VLEQIAGLRRSSILISPNHFVIKRVKNKPLNCKTLNGLLTSYLYDVDEKREFSIKKNDNYQTFRNVYPQYKITTHRLRHTLALQMYRAGLGIPLISVHLKHVYNAFGKIPFSDVTLGYGNIRKEIFRDVIAYDRAQIELHHALYHPDSPIAGPGAKIFNQSRNQIFIGRMENRSDKDILKELESSLPLMDVGLAYCMGRKEIKQDNGTKAQPPCIGNAMCDPSLCANAITTKYHIPALTKMFQDNKIKLEDKELAHWHEAFVKNKERAEKLLSELGVDISTL